MFNAIKRWFSRQKSTNANGLPLDDTEFTDIKGNRPYFNRLYSYGFRGEENEIAVFLIYRPGHLSDNYLIAFRVLYYLDKGLSLI